MHKSRLAGLIIDCKVEDLDAAAEFWGAALGYPTSRSTQPEEAEYVALGTPPDGPYIEVQRVSHPSRVHLDIESDDIEAEVARLEALGACRVATLERWVVLEAPTGQRFCVVHRQSRNFDETANVWPGAADVGQGAAG